MKKIILLFVLLLVASVGSAQTITQSLEWDHLNDVLANVNLYAFSLKIDTNATNVVTATCTTQGTGVHCKTPVTLATGNHTLVLTATNTFGFSTGTLNYVPGAIPTNPTNLKITIIISVP